MKYDKNGLPVKEYYTEELKKTPEQKMRALKYQKYYTGGSIVLVQTVIFLIAFLFAPRYGIFKNQSLLNND